jgi:hypothetical protein
LPHGPLTPTGGLWRVEGDLVSLPLKRVMVIARRTDGLLVVHNAMALEESAMKALEALGPVGFVVVPSGVHRLDAPLFKERYPNATFVCPAGARKKVEEVVPVDLTYDDFPHDDAVELRSLEGVKRAEGVMIVRAKGDEPGASGASLVFNDALFNMPHLPGLKGFVLKHVLQSSGELHVSRLFRLAVLKDKAAFARDLASLAETPDLRRILVAHHEVLEHDPAGALARVAASL